ncbi:hypothetical protein KIW84_074731 [Lathyrus oleraceus]|uniref:Uncharacterized protein n=1 Tax=Pisum sativum TaxID=3888 RepID=A0A9D4VT31_PEA|nr:hypothetical protein KIW84_074731 [Pisum sativum]
MHFPRSVWGLGNLLGKPVLVAKEYLTWALVKYVNSENCGVGNAENVLVAESYSKLNVALFLMHECFEILHNPYSSRDIVEEVIFNQRHVNAKFDDFYNHLVQEEPRNVSAPQPWSNAFDFIQWHFRVSRPYVTPDTHRNPPKLAHQEILYKEQARHIM